MVNLKDQSYMHVNTHSHYYDFIGLAKVDDTLAVVLL